MRKREFFFVDLETTANGGPTKLSPEAQWNTNRILLCGWAKSWTDITVNESPSGLILAMEASVIAGHKPVIVAHNAKFDIKHLMRYAPYSDIWGHCEVWDTMTWEYLFGGHIDKFISLDATCDRHGVSFKKSLDLGALIKAGVKMEDIPLTELIPYTHDDVQALREAWSRQHNLAIGEGVEFSMQHLLPLAEMELNGLNVDKPRLERLYTTKQQTIMSSEKRMMQHIVHCCEWQNGTPIDMACDFTSEIGLKSKEINMFARRTLSFLLTGVPAMLNITNKWQVRFKLPYGPTYGRVPANHPTYFQGKTNLGYEIDERVLAKDPSSLLAWASSHRKAEKIVSTYLGPMSESMAIQGTIHPKMNTAQTATGRLSSSQPNGQNMPPVVRELIIPKNPLNHIYEIDFKQLEMVAVACISGCPAMIAALQRGDDLHYLSGKTVMGWSQPSDMTEADRKIVKAVNFGVLYGGKAPGLSYQTGVKRDIVQKLINGFFKQFPGIAMWQSKVFTDVVDNMYPYDIKEGEQRYASMWTLPLTGRRFTFTETLSPGWLRKKTHRKWSFTPTQTSNYPIQGAAGGDFVMYALYWLWLEKSNYRFLLTVHDSLIIETNESLSSVQDAVTDMCAATTQHFALPVSLHCDVSVGKHWK